MKFRLTEEICKEANMYVSYCPELDISSYGEDVQQAKNNLYEAIHINIEETQRMGTFEKFLEDSSLESIDDGVFSVRKELVGFTSIEISAYCRSDQLIINFK